MWSINSARKKLFCHVIVKNDLCNVSCEFFYQNRKQVEAWNQRTNTTADFTYCGTTVRSSHRRCSIKKLFLKFHNIHRKHLRWSLFLILPILKNIFKRLLFNFFNGWLLHRPKLLRSRFYAGFRLQGSTYRSKFLFLSRRPSFWSESQPAFKNLRHIPLISPLSFYIGCFWSF